MKNGENKQTYIQESWLSDLKCSHWVQRAKLKTDYRCKPSKKENKLGSISVGALKMINELESVKENCQKCKIYSGNLILSLFICQKNPKKNNNIKFLNEGSALIRKGEEKSTHLEILK